MTREEAIKYLKLFRGYDLPIQEAFYMAIEALKAQLSAKDTTFGDVSTAYENGYQQGKFEALQSQQKKGKWIESEQRDRTICSVCGYWQDLKAKFLFSFCPNCGASMRCE